MHTKIAGSSALIIIALGGCGTEGHLDAPVADQDGGVAPIVPATPVPSPPSPSPPSPSPEPPTLDAGADAPGPPPTPSGVLDPSFAASGYLTRSDTAGPLTYAGDDAGYSLAIDSLGRVVVSGASRGPGYYHRAAVWRFDEAGATDATFGTGGVWLAPVQTSNNTIAVGIAVGPDDRPLLTGAGWRPSTSNTQAMTSWRLTTAGAPDASFSMGGQAFASTTPGASLARAIASDASGAPIVTGYRIDSGGNLSEATAWRPSANGVPNGFSLATGEPGWDRNRGEAVAVDPSGRIVVGGSSRTIGGASAAALWRFAADGTLDTSFNGTGHVALRNLGGPASISIDAVTSLTIDAEHGTVFAGITFGVDGQPRGFVARLTEAGTLDSTFGKSGVVIFEGRAPSPKSGSAARGVKIDAHGRILVAGSVITTNGTAVVWRLTSKGAPDTTFGTNGLALVDIPGFVNAYPYAIAVDRNDRAVVSGFTAPFGNSNRSLLVFRLTP